MLWTSAESWLYKVLSYDNLNRFCSIREGSTFPIPPFWMDVDD